MLSSHGESSFLCALITVCPGSIDAVQGALGTVCEAVDDVLNPSTSNSRAFVAVRPPGHHCGEVGFILLRHLIVIFIMFG